MKSFILIAVLAALTVCNNAASIADEAAQFVEDIVEVPEGVEEYRNIKDYKLEGVTSRKLSRNDGNILFYEESFHLEAIPNTVQQRDVFYRGNSTTQIRHIHFFYDLQTIPELAETHLFPNHAFVRFTSWVGRGLQATVQFYGIYTDWQ